MLDLLFKVLASLAGSLAGRVIEKSHRSKRLAKSGSRLFAQLGTFDQALRLLAELLRLATVPGTSLEDLCTSFPYRSDSEISRSDHVFRTDRATLGQALEWATRTLYVELCDTVECIRQWLTTIGYSSDLLAPDVYHLLGDLQSAEVDLLTVIFSEMETTEFSDGVLVIGHPGVSHRGEYTFGIDHVRTVNRRFLHELTEVPADYADLRRFSLAEPAEIEEAIAYISATQENVDASRRAFRTFLLVNFTVEELLI